MDDRKLVKADFIVSLLLVLFSGFLIVQSLLMPKYEKWGFYAMPAMTPFIFGSLLLLLSLILFTRSLLRGGHRIHVTRVQIAEALRSEGVKRFCAVLSFIILYFFALGKLNFVFVTAAFLFAMIWFFKGAKWWINLIISAATSFAVWFVFNQVFLVPLP
jgi:hypothetical protein